jgi:hypothetical protein
MAEGLGQELMSYALILLFAVFRVGVVGRGREEVSM